VRNQQFFFEKKNQKTLTRLKVQNAECCCVSKRITVSCFFFSKKKYHLFRAVACAAIAALMVTRHEGRALP